MGPQKPYICYNPINGLCLPSLLDWGGRGSNTRSGLLADGSGVCDKGVSVDDVLASSSPDNGSAFLLLLLAADFCLESFLFLLRVPNPSALHKARSSFSNCSSDKCPNSSLRHKQVVHHESSQQTIQTQLSTMLQLKLNMNTLVPLIH